MKRVGISSIVMTLVVFIITAAIAVFVGVRFYAVEKEVLRKQGQLNAKESAMEYNRYLLTKANIVMLVGYTADDLLADGADSEVIEKFLTDETRYITNTLDPDTTGIYGWLAGEYIDGAGWVPDDDYVPTERPWYVQTINSDEKITYVEPYLDAQTNTIMMTVSELLNDGRSVIAMDVSLAPIQQIVRQISSSTEGSQAIVLDKSGIVVAHSDDNQLGKNYLDDPDSLGGIVAKRLLIDGQMQFDIAMDEGNYSIYVDELEGGWYSISLINADIWYSPLRKSMILFFAILAVILIVLFAILLRFRAKDQALRQLHTKIDQEEKRGEALQILSETDRMTGLYDRVNGERKVNELLSAGEKGIFLELDVDNFKAINDNFGHQAGDLVIIAVAEALRATFRANDIIMRLGGDEFGVFAVGIVDQEMCEAVIQRLFNRIESIKISELNGEKFSVSVGTTFCAGEQEMSFNDMYAKADSAMYAGKKFSGNSVKFNS